MPAIFIDANILLGFWCLREGRLPSELLLPLVEMADHLLITRQVADEVERNKLTVFLKNVGEISSKLPPLIPDHLARHRRYHELNTELKRLEEISASARKQWNSATSELATAISESSDLVSEMLTPLFRKAEDPTEKQLAAARLRREVGNPPGKKGDPLGDQVSWEQFLDASNRQKEVWILTRDSDLAHVVDGVRNLNPFLRKELIARGVEKIHVFDNLSAAMKSLKDAGIGAKKLDDGELIELQKMEARDAYVAVHQAFFPAESDWNCLICSRRNKDRGLTAHPSNFGGWSYWITCSHCGARYDTGEPYDD
ncbi:PIN domain-containing protein (plasmid) [Agrobacterium tumefaciens]|uniref:PIN domain-containing protein n=1 Tax=Agrobacterium tumefaciens TaxID=358 RepID=UPI0015725FB1|nr:PIN domain-containing protein [Agrobacterium tumefaciens]NSZ66889.1 DUF4935 domain-containing protein [Agrobacterium tumefaciens]NTA73087.1 DUF4935 domain-containing protein [Agrobacterium tumefaciens]WIE41626.1 PIN domain-containing protein [Agrobacterium tumefaciens]